MNMQNSYLTSKPHYEILDGLRGVAAAMVVAFHLLEAHSGGNHLNQIINHGYLAVDFFFMLSGFVIGYAYDDRWNRMSTGTFFKRRLIRLQPMVVMGSIVGAALFWFQDAPCYPAMEGVSAGAVLLVMLLGLLQSCFSIFGGGVSSIVASSYLSEDSDLLAAEAAYCAMEDELREYLDTYEQTHDYDEYHFDLDEIKHDPYVLLSILSALHEGQFTIDQVQDDLQMLYDKQYILTETVTTETRYRTETRTDSEGNEYEVDVPYTYYICTVELENFDLSHVPVYIMDTETLSMYAVYMSTLGNRSDLFPSSGYVDKYITNPPEDYEIPAEYLSDERFAALITEAEKYLGYPYVWGGSSPSTSFDCSGFVSYVLTNSGLCNTGRLGAQGLYNISTRVSDPQPGDLVFFVGTYDTAGISHVGFYVGLDEAGNPMFLHCGDPIQYTRLNTSYWQQHFYAYGRPPYD